MKKALGVFSSVLSVILMVLIVRSYAGIHTTNALLKDSVWCPDGAPHPENEGKIVTVLLRTGEMEPACDRDMDIRFKSPVVRRHVEKLVEIPTPADGIWEWQWREIYEDSANEMGWRTFVGSVKGDRLQLSDKIENMLPLGDSVGLDDLTDESQESIEKKIGVRVGISRTYFSDASAAAFSGDLIAHDIIHPLFGDEGKIRVWYEKIPDDRTEFAITGVQRNGVLEKAEALDLSAVHEHIGNREELIRKATGETVLSTSFFLVGDLVLIYFSLRWLGILKKGWFVRKKAPDQSMKHSRHGHEKGA